MTAATDDMLPVSLVEMIVEQDRLWLANRRSWHAKEATGRLPSDKVARRLAIAEAILTNLRAQADPGTLAALEALAEKKLAQRRARAARKAEARALPAAPPP